MNFDFRSALLPGRKSLAVGLTILASLFMTNTAMSQGLGIDQYRELIPYRYLPRLPEGDENPAPLPRGEAPIAGSDRVLVGELKGLILVNSQADVVQGKIDMTGLRVNTSNGLSQSAEFYRMLEGNLGMPVSMRNLNSIIRDIVRFYRDNDEPVVDVSVPQQDITDGVVQMVLTETRVGQVRVEGPCYFNPQDLVDQVCISSGDPIYESWLLSDQRWLMRNPFRTVDLELRPGDLAGTTDVVFNVNDRSPWRYYAGYEDTGNRTTDLERLIFGVNWYDAFDRDDQFGYQYTSSPDFQTVQVHSASYSLACANRDILTIFGSYGQVQAPPVFNPFDTTGIFYHASLRWDRELSSWGCYEHGIQAGVDFKNTNSTLDFGGVFVFGSDADVIQMMAGYHGHEYTGWGSYHLGVDLYYSPGYISGKNDKAHYQQINARADPRYIYSRGFYELRRDLPNCWEFVARVTGQLASTNLLPPETLGFGGYNSIRGYDQFTFAADSGLYGNLEVWSHPISLNDCGNDELRFLGFYDIGSAWSHTAITGIPSNTDMQSIGVGMRYNYTRHLQARFDYGYRMKTPVGLPQPKSRVHLGVVVSY